MSSMASMHSGQCPPAPSPSPSRTPGPPSSPLRPPTAEPALSVAAAAAALRAGVGTQDLALAAAAAAASAGLGESERAPAGARCRAARRWEQARVWILRAVLGLRSGLTVEEEGTLSHPCTHPAAREKGWGDGTGRVGRRVRERAGRGEAQAGEG